MVLDLPGDLVERVMALCAKEGVDPARVTHLDLRNPLPTVGLNPFAGIGPPFIRALHFTEVIRNEADSWGVQIDEIARNTFLLLSEVGLPPTEVERVLTDMELLRSLCQQCEDPGVQSFFARYRSLSAEKRFTWAQPLLNKVSPLFATTGLRALFSAPTSIDLDGVLSTRGSILLCTFAVDQLQRSGRMVASLLVSAIARSMFARACTPSSLNPARLYVDEFQSMASESFAEIIEQGRRFQIGLLLAHQSLSQINPKLLSIVRNNVGLQVLFACGFQDARLLAMELPPGEEKHALLNLKPGHCFFLRRGQPTRKVKCHLVDTAVDPKGLAVFREAVRRPGPNLISTKLTLDVPRSTIEEVNTPWLRSEEE